MAIETPARPSSSAVDDLALARRLADRRPETLGELYDRHAPALLGIARRILGDAGEAEAAVQETFLDVWSQADRFDAARVSVPTWLVLVLRSRALDRRRSPGGRPTTAAVAQRETATPGADGAAFERRRQRVLAALAELPAAQRQVLELIFWEGLSRAELEERLGLTRETVRNLALAGLKALRRGLRDEIRELI